MKPTPEQESILDAVRTSKSNLMIRARAGCGKTSTLQLIDAATPTNLANLLICFNKSIAEDAKKKMRSSTTVKTFNSIGHQLWAEHCKKKLSLDTQKILGIYRNIVDEADKSERAFREAVTLDEAFIEAGRELRLIEMRKSKSAPGKPGAKPEPPRSGGLMGKLFKK